MDDESLTLLLATASLIGLASALAIHPRDHRDWATDASNRLAAGLVAALCAAAVTGAMWFTLALLCSYPS